jgi:hypothetical protein
MADTALPARSVTASGPRVTATASTAFAPQRTSSLNVSVAISSTCVRLERISPERQPPSRHGSAFASRPSPSFLASSVYVSRESVRRAMIPETARFPAVRWSASKRLGPCTCGV